MVQQGERDMKQILVELEQSAPLVEQMSEVLEGNTAQYGGTSGGAFSDICCLQISRFTASKPSKSAIASVEKFTRQLTTLIARYFLKHGSPGVT